MYVLVVYIFATFPDAVWYQRNFVYPKHAQEETEMSCYFPFIPVFPGHFIL